MVIFDAFCAVFKKFRSICQHLGIRLYYQAYYSRGVKDPETEIIGGTIPACKILGDHVPPVPLTPIKALLVALCPVIKLGYVQSTVSVLANGLTGSRTVWTVSSSKRTLQSMTLPLQRRDIGGLVGALMTAASDHRATATTFVIHQPSPYVSCFSFTRNACDLSNVHEQCDESLSTATVLAIIYSTRLGRRCQRPHNSAQLYDRRDTASTVQSALQVVTVDDTLHYSMLSLAHSAIVMTSSLCTRVCETRTAVKRNIYNSPLLQPTRAIV